MCFQVDCGTSVSSSSPNDSCCGEWLGCPMFLSGWVVSSLVQNNRTNWPWTETSKTSWAQQTNKHISAFREETNSQYKSYTSKKAYKKCDGKLVASYNAYFLHATSTEPGSYGILPLVMSPSPDSHIKSGWSRKERQTFFYSQCYLVRNGDGMWNHSLCFLPLSIKSMKQVFWMNVKT